MEREPGLHLEGTLEPQGVAQSLGGYHQTASEYCVSSHLWLPHGKLVKNPPAMQETQVRSLGGKDPLEKEMATHSSILTWEIPWTEEPGWL